jgi:hypothetical protein
MTWRCMDFRLEQYTICIFYYITVLSSVVLWYPELAGPAHFVSANASRWWTENAFPQPHTYPIEIMDR